MNKIALKKFAIEARRELLEKIELQARKLGITAESIQKANIESSDAVFIEGRQLSNTERKQRNKLIERINDSGFGQVMEETAYTWFNRFVALRFMEVNEYLPTNVRVLSSSFGSAEPDMMKEALSLNLELDKEKVYTMKMNNDINNLFKYLVKVHCNDLNQYMPFMFETIEDYTEILFPEGLLGTDSFVRKMTNKELISEDDWTNVEIIGWLYQFYIAEEKERVFKSKEKYKAEEIPFATQLFTPDWIVQYMVQNSLGRYWTEAHPDHSDLIKNWKYYLTHDQEGFLEKIEPYVNKGLNVEDIKCFDPAMGSGHILVYMFDVLYEIYNKCGYLERDIPRLIIEKNLYGLEIDDRAYQLASFSVVMKAMQYNRRFLKNIKRFGLSLNLSSIQETNRYNEEEIAFIAEEKNGSKFNLIKIFFEQYVNAKTYGSLIKVNKIDTDYLEKRLKEIEENPAKEIFESEIRDKVLYILPQLIKQTKIMCNQYDIVVMNPPYMGARNMNNELSDFLKKNYPDSKADLFSSFMEVDHYLTKNGFYAAINQHSWMFLSSFEKLRIKIINNKFIDTMLHLGPRVFEEINGEVVQSTSFVFRNVEIPDGKGIYIRLIEEKTSSDKRIRTIEANIDPSISYRYTFNQLEFSKLPINSISYWISSDMLNIFSENLNLANIAEPRLGMATANNDMFLRFWYEVIFDNIKVSSSDRMDALLSGCRWFPYNKGGEFRKWYGNNDYVVDWENDGKRIRNYKNENGKIRSHNYNLDYIFKPGITWSALSTGAFSSRFFQKGYLFDNSGSSLFAENIDDLYRLQGFLSTNIVQKIFPLINPTLNYQPGTIGQLPIKLPKTKETDELLIRYVKENILIAKAEWDEFETSMEFIKHPFLKFSSFKINEVHKMYHDCKEIQNNKLKSNESHINRIFAELYGLKDDITFKKKEYNSVTSVELNLQRDVKSFISYAIGCSFGRYSLDDEGLIFAGGKFENSIYKKFPVDSDNILPVMSEAFFKDDILNRFIDFVKTTFSEGTLEENLTFLANALGRKNNETARETLRRYFINDFYKNHIQVYKKRPIYWLFTSGKEKAFNCLIYMHRYDKTTLSRVRTDYLHEVQTRLDSEKDNFISIINGDSTTKEISIAKKELKSLEKKIDELKIYDELLHHLADMHIEIDLDDGVKINYEKFKGLVAKIK